MAAPLSGIGQQQAANVLPQAAQPVSSDQTRDIRQSGQTPREDQIQPRSAASSQSQESEDNNNESIEERALSFFTSNDAEGQDLPRGSVVNLVV
ncbi:MAG: hypothetical protein ACRBDL_09695 [Alphaproteobacteria bacterium]